MNTDLPGIACHGGPLKERAQLMFESFVVACTDGDTIRFHFGHYGDGSPAIAVVFPSLGSFGFDTDEARFCAKAGENIMKNIDSRLQPAMADFIMGLRAAADKAEEANPVPTP